MKVRILRVPLFQVHTEGEIKHDPLFLLVFLGIDCCSDNAISFHYIRPEQFYVLDYLLYHLRPYGVIAYPQPLPKKVNFPEILKLLEDEKPEGAPNPELLDI